MSKNLNTFKTFNIHEKTPNGLYEKLNEEFNFDFDPCPLNPEFDGLNINWGKRCFINPPYGKAIKSWLEQALNELAEGGGGHLNYVFFYYLLIQALNGFTKLF